MFLVSTTPIATGRREGHSKKGELTRASDGLDARVIRPGCQTGSSFAPSRPLSPDPETGREPLPAPHTLAFIPFRVERPIVWAASRCCKRPDRDSCHIGTQRPAPPWAAAPRKVSETHFHMSMLLQFPPTPPTPRAFFCSLARQPSVYSAPTRPVRRSENLCATRSEARGLSRG